MNYDLSLFKKVPGMGAAELAGRAQDALDPFTADELKAAAAAVQAAVPELALFEDDEETRYEFTHQATGLQVELCPHSMAVAVPYWHEGAAAEAVFAAINKVLDAINGVVPVVVHDPQQGKEIDPVQGLSASEAAYYGKTTTHVQEIMSTPSPRDSAHARLEGELARKPWWKFW